MLIVNRLSHPPMLKQTELVLRPGKLYTLLGQNGSGKTTLFKLMAGLIPRATGELLYNDTPLQMLDRMEMSRTISYVSQKECTFPYTVRQIVEMGRYPHGLPIDKSLIDWALCAVDVIHLQDRIISELSQGEQQRVLIARSLVTKTPILLLDEPTSNLDIRHQVQIWELMRSLAEEGRYVICSSHHLTHTAKYADEVILLSRQKVIGQGSYQELLHQGLLDEAFLMDLSEQQIEDVRAS